MNEAIRRKAGRWGWTVALTALLIWAFRGTEFDGRRLIQGIPRGWSFIREMFPPDWSLLWKSADEGGALANLVVTLQMAVIGTFIGFVLALPVSFLAARTEVVPRPVSIAVKYSLNVLRAVPSFVYAVLFVYMVGLGPFTGALGIGVGSFVFMAKLFAEALESVHPAPIEAVKAVGARPAQIFAYAMLPQAFPQFLSHTLYAWEINIGAATILGIVGAGGLGQSLITDIHYYKWPQVSAYVLVLVAMVLLADAISYQVRKRYT